MDVNLKGIYNICNFAPLVLVLVKNVNFVSCCKHFKLIFGISFTLELNFLLSYS